MKAERNKNLITTKRGKNRFSSFLKPIFKRRIRCSHQFNRVAITCIAHKLRYNAAVSCCAHSFRSFWFCVLTHSVFLLSPTRAHPNLLDWVSRWLWFESQRKKNNNNNNCVITIDWEISFGTVVCAGARTRALAVKRNYFWNIATISQSIERKENGRANKISMISIFLFIFIQPINKKRFNHHITLKIAPFQLNKQ